MRKLLTKGVLIFAFLFLFGVDAVTQTFLDDLKSVRSIRLLEAGPDAIAKLAERVDQAGTSSNEPTYSFSLTNSYVRIEYSDDKCSQESDSQYMSGDDWDVPKSKVTGIEISPWEFVDLKDLGIDVTRFHNERLYRSRKNVRILFDKDAGIGIETHVGMVEKIFLFPSRSNLSLLCKSEPLRKFYLSDKWHRYPDNKRMIVDFNRPAQVTDLRVTEIVGEAKKFAIEVVAKDPENDVMTFDYSVSAGKIVGVGANVIWDLSAASPGAYKITAGVDDGCGVCGRIMSRVVTIK